MEEPVINPIARLLVPLAMLLAATAQAAAGPTPQQRAAAEAGDVRAQYALGIIYDNGIGVPVDYVEGFKWFRLSAEGGYAPAQAKMGLMYLFGWEIRRDAAEAFRWYELAARQGEVRAQAQIASMYDRGTGVTKDPVRAVMWTIVAANAGDAQSKDRLRSWAARLSPEELAEAERLAKAWRPGR